MGSTANLGTATKITTFSHPDARLARPGLTAAIFLLVLTLYLAFPVKDYFFDGIYFAQTIEDSHSLNLFLFHPNHLFYTATGYAMYQAAHALGLHPRALDLLVLFNTLVSALAVASFFQLLLAISSSPYLSSVLALAFAFSATWWRYAPNADAYIPSIFFLILSFYLLLPNRPARPVTLALTHSLAMLFHQLAVMFYPVALLGLLLPSASDSSTTRLRRAAFYTAIAVTIVVSAYSLIFRWGIGRPLRFTEFRHWVMFHDPAVGFEFSFAHSLRYTLQGTAQLFFATKLSLMGSDRLPRILLALAVLLAWAGMVQLVRYRKELHDFFPALPNADRMLVLLASLWIVMYIGFLFFWVPSNQHYRPFYAAPVFLLIGILWSPYERTRNAPRRFRAALLVAAYALLNFSLLILPLSRPQNTPTLAFSAQIRPLWPRGTVVYYSDYIHTLSNWTMRYFNPQTEWRQAPDGQIPLSDAELDRIYKSGGTVWFDTTVTDLAQWHQAPFDAWLRTHTRADSLHPLPKHGWNVHFLQVFPAPGSAQ